MPARQCEAQGVEVNRSPFETERGSGHSPTDWRWEGLYPGVASVAALLAQAIASSESIIIILTHTGTHAVAAVLSHPVPTAAAHRPTLSPIPPETVQLYEDPD